MSRKIAVRMDDITPDMDWQKFFRFKELLDLYQVKPLIGVVPENRDENLKRDLEKEDYWEYIRDLQKQGWTIAMHGCYHVYDSNEGGIFPLNHFSEFAGHPFALQEEKIRKGKQVLEEKGILTDIFMAPGHSYDKNTLKALKQNGFTRMTDGFGESPYCYRGITFYPISFLLKKSLEKKKGYTTMVIHANTLEDFSYYEAVLETHKEKLISFEEYLKAPAVTAGFGKRVGEYLLASLKHLLVNIKTGGR